MCLTHKPYQIKHQRIYFSMISCCGPLTFFQKAGQALAWTGIGVSLGFGWVGLDRRHVVELYNRNTSKRLNQQEIVVFCGALFGTWYVLCGKTGNSASKYQPRNGTHYVLALNGIRVLLSFAL